jgi:hypothetical protein
MLHEKPQNLFLLRLCFSRSRTTATGVLSCEKQRCRAVPVGGTRVSATIDERPYGRGAAIAHGTVQRSDAALVDRIRVGASPDEPGNDLRLGTRIPCRQARPTINGIVKGLRAASVPRANVRAPGDQLLGDAYLICRCRDMQGGIALVDVVQDLAEKVLFGGLPSGAMSSAFFCQ